MLPTRLFEVISVTSLLLSSLGPARRQSQSNDPPSLPFTDKGACPFEGCQYGSWIAGARAIARRDSDTGSRIEFVIQSGEKITALSGKVITRQYGIVRARKPLAFDDIDTSKVPYSSRKLEIPAGAVLYVLHEEGEGYCLYWYNGAIHHQDLYAEGVHKGTDDFPWDVDSIPTTEWWVNVKNHAGQTGWILNPTNFHGMDALGGK